MTETTPEGAPAPKRAPAAPAGWYPVSSGSAQLRWWDGTRWTEHVYGPPAAAVMQPELVQPAGAEFGAVGQVTALRAPDGTKPNTSWFWLMAIGVPVLTVLNLIPVSIYIDQVISGSAAGPAALAAITFGPAFALTLLSSWFIYAVCIVFALLDWRELRARDVPSPFHWAWSFFVLAIGWPVVYVIGRTVIVRRRTGGGLAPLWVFIGLEVVAFIVTLVIAISAFLALITLFGNGLSASGSVF